MPKWVLTAAALLARCMAWFPFWMLLLCLWYPASFLAGCGLLLGCSFLGAGLYRALRPRRWGGVVGVLCLSGCTALCMAGMRWAGIGWFTALVLAAVTIWVAGLHSERETEQLFVPAAYGAFLTGALLVPLLLQSAVETVPMGWMLAVAAGITTIFFLLRNQLMLHRLVNRRSGGGYAVPSEIRRGNLLLLGGILLLVGLMLLCHQPLIAGLKLCGKALVACIGGLLRGLNWLIAKAGGNAPIEEMPPLEESTGEAMEYRTGSPLWNLLLIPLAVVAIWMWRTLLADWLETVRDWLAALAIRFQPRAGSPRTNAVGEYADTETAAVPIASKRKQKHRWQKQVRAWQALPDSPEKFYAGYALLLSAPAWMGQPPHGAETVREIRSRWEAMQRDAGLLDDVTADFEAIRYEGQALPADAISAMAAALRRMRGLS